MTSENGPPIDDRTHDPGLHLFLDDHEVASVTNSLGSVDGRAAGRSRWYVPTAPGRATR